MSPEVDPKLEEEIESCFSDSVHLAQPEIVIVSQALTGYLARHAAEADTYEDAQHRLADTFLEYATDHKTSGVSVVYTPNYFKPNPSVEFIRLALFEHSSTSDVRHNAKLRRQVIKVLGLFVGALEKVDGSSDGS